jgi:hypothetical protein
MVVQSLLQFPASVSLNASEIIQIPIHFDSIQVGNFDNNEIQIGLRTN